MSVTELDQLKGELDDAKAKKAALNAVLDEEETAPEGVDAKAFNRFKKFPPGDPAKVRDDLTTDITTIRQQILAFHPPRTSEASQDHRAEVEDRGSHDRSAVEGYQPAQLKEQVATPPTSEGYSNLDLGGDWASYGSDSAAEARCSYFQYEFCVFNETLQYDAKIRPAIEAFFQDFNTRVAQHENSRPSDTHLATKWEARLLKGVEARIVTVNMIFPSWVGHSLEQCIHKHILAAGFSADGLLSKKKPVRKVRHSGKCLR